MPSRSIFKSRILAEFGIGVGASGSLTDQILDLSSGGTVVSTTIFPMVDPTGPTGAQTTASDLRNYILGISGGIANIPEPTQLGSTLGVTGLVTATAGATTPAQFTVTGASGAFAVNPTLGTGGVNFQNAGVNRLIMRLDSAAAWSLNPRDTGGAAIDAALSLTLAAGGAFTSTRSLVVQDTALATSYVVAAGFSARTASTYFNANAAAGYARGYAVSTANVIRWLIYGTSTAEGGSDTGTNFGLAAYSDAGANIDSPIVISRPAGGVMTLSRPVRMNAQLSFSITPAANALLYAASGATVSGNTALYGMYWSPTFSADGTGSMQGVQILPRSEAATYTTSSVMALSISDMVRGAGHTVTTLYGIYVNTLTQGATNWAIYTNGATASRFGGNVTVAADGITVTGNSAITGTLLVTGLATLSASGQHIIGSSAGTAINVALRAAAGAATGIIFTSGTSARWELTKTSTAESGSDAGSNIILAAYTDVGVAIDNPVAITRAAGGAMTLARPVSMSSTLVVTSSLTTNGTSALLAQGASATVTIGASASTETRLVANGAASTLRQLVFATGNSFRWNAYAANNAEAGSDAGSSFRISAYSDAGAFIDTVLDIARAAAGTFTVSRPFAATSTLAVTGIATFSDRVNVYPNGTTILNLRDGTGTVDQREFSFRINAGTLSLRSVLDANTTVATVMNVTHATGATSFLTTLTVSAGGIVVTGNSTITGTLSGITNLTVSGNVATGGGAVSDAYGVYVRPTFASAAVSQYAIRVESTASVSATTNHGGLYIANVGDAGVHTTTLVTGLRVAAYSKGASQTIASMDILRTDASSVATTGGTQGLSIGALSGTGTTNYGVLIGNVTGATTNYSIATGTGMAYFGGNVGAGTAPLDYVNLYVRSIYAAGVTATTQHGIYISTVFSASATAAINGIAIHYNGNASSHTTAAVTGISVAQFTKGASQTVTALSGIGIAASSVATTNGTRGLSVGSITGTGTNNYGVFVQAVASGTNNYGLYIESVTGGTLNYAIYTGSGQHYFGGLVAVNGATISTSTALITTAGTTAVSSLRIPHGSAPTSPVNGDIWTTTAGLYVRINGVTVGPLT